MKSYWVKIALGAIAIFAVGMVIVTAIRKATRQVHIVRETAEPIRIPFPFGIVPFRLDGAQLGTIEHLTLLREAPDGISSVRIMVKLDEQVTPARLQDCVLVIREVKNLDNRTTFTCAGPRTAGDSLVEYGELEIDGQGSRFPLLVPAEVAADLRGNTSSDELERRVDSIAAAAEAVADSLAGVADSVTEANNARADSIHDAAEALGDSLREAAHRMADSIRQRRRTAPQVPVPPTP